MKRSLLALTTLALTATSSVATADVNHAPEGDAPYTFVVFGDTPYGDTQVAGFPTMIDAINEEAPEMVFHVGDTKSGSTLCTDEYNTFVKDEFNRLNAPLFYTPGDNEWTDCHRVKAGGYNPLERLDAIRDTYFATPGKTLGANPLRVNHGVTVPENMLHSTQGVTFATVHVVGSNDGSMPWKGIGNETETFDQRYARQTRDGANRLWVKEAFRNAKRHGNDAVALFMQADMFYTVDGEPQPSWKYSSEFTKIVHTIADESNNFDGEVYLINGDSHIYNTDNPLAEGSVWLDHYKGVDPVDNLTRITVDGEYDETSLLKVTINESATNKLTWERVPFAFPVAN